MPVTPSSCALLVIVLIVTACSARQDPGDGIPVDETGRFWPLKSRCQGSTACESARSIP